MASFVLANAYVAFGEPGAVFARRASIPRPLVAGDEDGICLAWSWPVAEFTAVAAAIEVRGVELARWFVTAAGCDLLLTSVLNGTVDLVAAQTLSQRPGWALLRWAVRGEPPTAGQVRMRPSAPLLPQAQRRRLRARAQELAACTSPAAGVGSDLLALFAARCPDAPLASRVASPVLPQPRPDGRCLPGRPSGHGGRHGVLGGVAPSHDHPLFREQGYHVLSRQDAVQ